MNEILIYIVTSDIYAFQRVNTRLKVLIKFCEDHLQFTLISEISQANVTYIST